MRIASATDGAAILYGRHSAIVANVTEQYKCQRDLVVSSQRSRAREGRRPNRPNCSGQWRGEWVVNRVWLCSSLRTDYVTAKPCSVCAVCGLSGGNIPSVLLSWACDGHSGERWVCMGVASPVLPALAHTRNVPRRGVGGEARPPRDDNFILATHLLRRGQDRGRCGGGAPAQGRAE